MTISLDDSSNCGSSNIYSNNICSHCSIKFLSNVFCTLCIPLILTLLPVFIAGAIFEQGTDEVQSAFKYAMLNHNLNVSSRRFELQAYVDVINTADAFKLSRLSE